MNQSSLPRKIRRRLSDGTITRSDLYDLLLYHLKQRNWDDYSSMGWRPTSPPDAPSRILITELSSIGDVAVTLPLVDAVANRWDDADVDFLCESECSVSLVGHPEIVKLWELPVGEWRRWIDTGDPQQARQALRDLVNRIKRRRYDYVINPHWNPFPALLNWFLDPDHVNGLTIDGKLNPYMTGNPLRNLKLEQMRTSNGVAVPLNPASSKRLNASIHEGKTCFYQRSDPSEKDGIKTLFNKEVDQNRNHVLINTGSRMEGRRWPADHCAKVIQGLHDAEPMEFGLVGGPSDKDRLRRVVERLPDDIALVPWFEKTDKLMEDVYLADLSDLIITTDSGPQHLISIRGNNVVTLAGDMWVGPWNRDSLVVRRPSGSINALRVDDVLGAVNQLDGDKDDDDFEPGVQVYQSPLPSDDFWFRNVRCSDRSNSDFRGWLSGLLSVQLWSYEARSRGWKALEITGDDFRRLYDTFWTGEFQVNQPSDLTVIGSSALSSEVLGRRLDILQRWSSHE